MITLENGNIQGPNGLMVPYGSMTMQLNVDATVIAVPGGFVGAALEIVFQFDATGNLVQPALIWSNAELNPQNENGLGTYYLVTFYDANGARINSTPMWWQFPEAAGSTVDISQIIPVSTVGGNVIFYPTLSLTPAGPTNAVQINGGSNALYADAGFEYLHTTRSVQITALPSQTADLFDIFDSNSDVLVGVNASGLLTANNGLTVSGPTVLSASLSATAALIVNASATETGLSGIQVGVSDTISTTNLNYLVGYLGFAGTVLGGTTDITQMVGATAQAAHLGGGTIGQAIAFHAISPGITGGSGEVTSALGILIDDQGSDFAGSHAEASAALSIATQTNGGLGIVTSTGPNTFGDATAVTGLLSANGGLLQPLTTPSSSSATGTAGQICWDASYIYVCTAANTWTRVAITTF